VTAAQSAGVAVTVEQRQADLNRRWWIIERAFERRRGRKKGKRPSIATLRVCELNRLFYTRYGQMLPDDDAGLADALIMINHVIMLADGRQRVLDWCRRCAPWFLDQAEHLLDKLIRRPRKYRADRLGQLLNLTSEERDRLKIHTIGAVDLDREQRKQRRRERDKKAKQEKRKAAGATPRAQSISQTKPWLVLGISRSKWYADQQKSREVVVPRDSGQFRRQYEAGVTVDEFVQASARPTAPDEPQRWLGSRAVQQPLLGQPLEPTRSLEASGNMPSRAAVPSDWRQASAKSWTEIAELQADIRRSFVERIQRQESA
jgi:Zn-finger nucleic acid-binding protein